LTLRVDSHGQTRPGPPAAPQLSIVVPAYNEETRLGPTFESIRAFLESLPMQAEVLIVDDGSTDATPRRVEEALARLPMMRLLRNPGNKGKGFSIRHGFTESRGRWVLLTDADLSTPLEEFHKLLPYVTERGFSAAIGSRAVDPSTVEVPQGWLRRNMGVTFNRLVRLFTSLPFRDTQCGFKLLDREAFAPIFRLSRVDRFSYDVEVLMLAHRRGIRIAEVPVIWRNSPQSKVHFLTDSLQMLKDIVGVVLREKAGGYRERT